MAHRPCSAICATVRTNSRSLRAPHFHGTENRGQCVRHGWQTFQKDLPWSGRRGFRRHAAKLLRRAFLGARPNPGQSSFWQQGSYPFSVFYHEVVTDAAQQELNLCTGYWAVKGPGSSPTWRTRHCKPPNEVPVTVQAKDRHIRQYDCWHPCTRESPASVFQASPAAICT